MPDAAVIALAFLGACAWGAAWANYRRARTTLAAVRAMRADVLEADARLDAKRRELRSLSDRAAAAGAVLVDADFTRAWAQMLERGSRGRVVG